jgi:hypothetical protein
VQEEGTQDQLFYKANRFFIDNFKNTKSGIQTSDKENGIIIAKGSNPVKYVVESTVNYVIEVAVKDGKYKYKIDGVEFEMFYKGRSIGVNTKEDLLQKKQNKQTKKQIAFIDDTVNALILSLKAAMKQPTSDW